MQLPPVGTSELLKVLSPHIPDDFINQRFALQRREGRRLRFSAAQLWRVHLLVLLTHTFSFNALVRRLVEQEQWRRFAHLRNRFAVPDVRMLSDFRRALGAGGLRQINRYLLLELLASAPLNPITVAFIDATDLPANTAFKKNKRTLDRPSGDAGGAIPPAGQNPFLRRLQKTCITALDQRPCFSGHAGPLGLVGDASACARRLFAQTQPLVLPKASRLVARCRCG
jgi:Transposase domain (DUF772)